MTTQSTGPGVGFRPVALLTAAHIGPGLAVTTVVGVLSAAHDLSAATAVFLTAGAFAGQLTVGWGNDLLDAGRDRLVGRTDKPVATGELSPALVAACLVVAGAACVALSLAAGWRSGLVHLLLGVAAGHAYNLGLKATVFSWLPYAVAFGSLPAAVTLAGSTPDAPAWWMVSAAAGLGVAAHLLNTLPDFAADAATGIQGLPHRLGARVTRVLATFLLVAASAVAVIGAPGRPSAGTWAALGVVLVLAAVTLAGRGKAPFHAAIAIALLDVALLAAVSG